MLPMQPAGTLRRDAPIVGPLKPQENCNPQARPHPQGPSIPKHAAVPVCAKHSRFQHTQLPQFTKRFEYKERHILEPQ